MSKVPVCALTGAVIPRGAPLWWMVVADFGDEWKASTLLRPGLSCARNATVAPQPGPCLPPDDFWGSRGDPFHELSVYAEKDAEGPPYERCAVFAPAVADACDRHFRVTEMAEAHLDKIRAQSRGLWQIYPKGSRERPAEQVVPQSLWNVLLPLQGWYGSQEVALALGGDAEARRTLWRTLAVIEAARHIGHPGRLPYLGQAVGLPTRAEHARREEVFALLGAARASHEAASQDAGEWFDR